MAQAESAKHKTGHIRGPRDLLAKLDYETSVLSKAYQDKGTTQVYHAFNCAVTAWHICDWIIAALTPEQLAHVETRAKAANLDKLTLQSLVCHECKMLDYCRQIATAVKHAEVSKGANPDLKMTLESSTDAFVNDAGEMEFKEGQGVFISIGDQWMVAANVFREAQRYWKELLDYYCVA